MMRRDKKASNIELIAKTVYKLKFPITNYRVLAVSCTSLLMRFSVLKST
jgi:hypothetical protein